jgi:polygalacturonase
MNKFIIFVNLILFIHVLHADSKNIDSNIIYCSPNENLQKCMDKAAGKELRLLDGIHKSYMLTIPSNTTLYIPKGATIKLADDAVMPHKGGYVVGVHGTKEEKIQNVRIILDGIIDGNNKIHPYEKSGNEGINFKWVANSMIIGNGTIKNCSGDGIDIDVSFKCIFSGVKLLNNSGTGFHFGSPRPIEGSENNVVTNIYAENNGFKNKRNGIDLSWPNPNGAIFVNCIAKDNYRNWAIEAKCLVINSKSITQNKKIKNDEFGGSLLTQINGVDITNTDFVKKKNILLFINDLKKIFGKENKMYQGIEYEW